MVIHLVVTFLKYLLGENMVKGVKVKSPFPKTTHDMCHSCFAL